MPIMTITTLKNKSQEDKAKLAKELTEEVHAVTKLPYSIIRVIFREISFGSYAVAGEIIEPDANGQVQDDDTFLRILLITGRTAAEKENISEHLAAVLRRNPAFSGGAIRIIIEETPEENFYRSNVRS